VTDTPRPNPDVVSRRVGDDFVLVHMRTNRIYALNQTGGRLWELLSDGRDLQGALSVLLEEFDISEEQLRQEAGSLVAQLEDEQLLVAAD
jgi:hypothetical protein